MEELRAWSSVTAGRQRVIGSRRNISGRNISLKGLTGRESVSIILLQKVLPTMQSSITCFCCTCGPAPLCYTTHICFDLGQQLQTSQHLSTQYTLVLLLFMQATENVIAKIWAPSKIDWRSFKACFKDTLCFKGELLVVEWIQDNAKLWFLAFLFFGLPLALTSF